MTEETLLQVQELLESAASNLKTADMLLREYTGTQHPGRERLMQKASTLVGGHASVSGKIIEGVFDGQNMIDAEGNSYPVPANYASKSKLVEGDGMKLTITDEGKFIYKQIAPIERRAIKGVLIQEDGQYKVLADGKIYRVLLASVTFYRAEVGDQVVILIPKDGEAQWGAIDAVIPRHLAETTARAQVEKSMKDEDGELRPMMDIA